MSTVEVSAVEVYADGPESPAGPGIQVRSLATQSPVSGQRHRFSWQSTRTAPSRPVVGAPASAPVAREVSWRRSYRRTLVGLDLLSAIIAGSVALALRFGHLAATSDSVAQYRVLAVLFPLVWVASVALSRGYDERYLGTGPEEYQRVSRSLALLLAIVAITSYALKADVARGFVFVALPLVLVLDLLFRFVARKRLHGRRSRGQALSSVLVIGHPSRVADLAADLRRDSFAGLDVVGACVPDDVTDPAGLARLAELGIDVLGCVDDIKGIVLEASVDMVAVTSSHEVDADKLRWIAWQLEGTSAELAVSPGLVDVAGTRINVRLAAGLPLVYVEAPRFSGPHKVMKGVFDRTLAGLAVLVFSPILLVLAALVRFGSKGPAFFLQTRVGKDGKTFTMVKFRSMYTDAEARLGDLADQNQNADGLLFKMRDDPRVTKIGKVLRRYSLDELPQLLNVVMGSMSLVGPRPPLPKEVGLYGDDVRRRLLVKPGLTGLWQVSGRSDLSWEDSVRLDLRYVENWSMTMDLQVLWKTGRAVLGASGAY